MSKQDDILFEYLPQWGTRKVTGEEVADVLLSLRQQLEELTQERDEWMQQAEHRRVIIRDRKAQVQKLKEERLEAVDGWARWEARAIEAERERDLAQRENNIWKMRRNRAEAQVQKYKDKLTRCSAMFDEVENALAESCRREGKLKEALEKIDSLLIVVQSVSLKVASQINSYEIREIIQEALQSESKEKVNLPGFQLDDKYPNEDMELCPECGDRAVVLGADYNTCVSCGDEDVVFVPSKDMVLVPREPTVKMIEAGAPFMKSYGAGHIEAAYKAMIKAAEKPDLSKCPNCGGLADNGHDRCDPPNAYYCTKCSKSEKGKVLGALYRGTIEDKSDDK